MPSSLVTDWKRVAQSGHTMDGRVIKPEWLSDMAESYDPNVYTAKIWIDHMRYMSYGSVAELKTEKDSDVTRLYAKLVPSRSLLQLNQVWEEKLHFSIEVMEDFAKTGKTYLVGLAMTDEPASLGTDELRFARITGRTFTHKIGGEPVPDLREQETGAELEAENFFKRLFKAFQTNKQDEQQGDDSMEKEHFEKLNTGIDTLNQSMTTLLSAITKMAEGQGEGEQEAGTAGDETTPPAGEEQLMTKLSEVTGIVNGLKDEFKAIKDRLEKAAPGTEFNETHAPAEDEGII